MESTRLQSGQLSEVIAAAIADCKVQNVKCLTLSQKLDALCDSLGFTHAQLDALIVENSPVMRTVKGHCFEAFFDELLEDAGYCVEVQGGDDPVDRIVHGNTLQLKTPNTSGTKNGNVEYKTHKTHGAKSEREGMNYYHLRSEFASFLVGLISYEPLRILVLERNELPGHPKDANRIRSPFKLEWGRHEALNAFSRIGIDFQKLKAVQRSAKSLWLPRSAAAIGVHDEVIVQTLFSEENFRIWDMSVRGFACEHALIDILKQRGKTVLEPTHCSRDRANKSDLALVLASGSGCRHFQVKGLTFSQCLVDAEEPIVDIETQLSRGRVNDHPTQSRLYLESDFDGVIVALGPPMADTFLAATGQNREGSWKFYEIPTSDLVRHPSYPTRIKSHQRLAFLDLQAYSIDDAWLSQWR
jgi:hypothetical protein